MRYLRCQIGLIIGRKSYLYYVIVAVAPNSTTTATTGIIQQRSTRCSATESKHIYKANLIFTYKVSQLWPCHENAFNIFFPLESLEPKCVESKLRGVQVKFVLLRMRYDLIWI